MYKLTLSENGRCMLVASTQTQDTKLAEILNDYDLDLEIEVAFSTLLEVQPWSV